MYRIIYFKETISLNHPTISQNVLRIPEVFVRVRQAQECLEKNEGLIDLRNLFYLLSIGEFPSQQEVPQSLWHKVITILQVGLCDRHLKSQHQIPIFMANAHNDDAAKISSGLLSVKNMLLNSQSFYTDTESGQRNLSLFQPIQTHDKKHTTGYQQINTVIKTSEDLSQYIQMYQMSQLIVIGPTEPVTVSEPCKSNTDWLLSEIANSAILSDKIEVIESIDLDPLLFWFWKDHNKQKDIHKNSLFS